MREETKAARQIAKRYRSLNAGKACWKVLAVRPEVAADSAGFRRLLEYHIAEILRKQPAARRFRVRRLLGVDPGEAMVCSQCGGEFCGIFLLWVEPKWRKGEGDTADAD